MPVEFIVLYEQRIAFEQQGDGDPLLLLHGLPGDSRLWRRQLDTLSDEFTVIAWDAPGCGQSSDPAGPFGTRDVAKYLATFIAELQLVRPHVLGLSWGTGVALELYRVAPTLVGSLTLASGYAGWAGSLPPLEVRKRLDAYEAACVAPRDDALREWGPGFFTPTTPNELVEEALAITSDFHPTTLASLARSFAETDLRATLPLIAVPTLILHGDADVRSPLVVGEALHDAIPGSELVVLNDVGHISNMQAPEAFNSAVRGFLRSVPRAT